MIENSGINSPVIFSANFAMGTDVTTDTVKPIYPQIGFEYGSTRHG